mgnify:CR=1 FL=1
MALGWDNIDDAHEQANCWRGLAQSAERRERDSQSTRDGVRRARTTEGPQKNPQQYKEDRRVEDRRRDDEEDDRAYKERQSRASTQRYEKEQDEAYYRSKMNGDQEAY